MSGPDSMPPGPFPETSRSLVAECREAREKDGLERLFTRYWGPVYGFVLRRWTRDPERARDLTQAYFLRFLERDFLASIDAGKGRFRSFVMASLRHFLANESRDDRRLKRRPPEGFLSLDALRRFVPLPEPTTRDVKGLEDRLAQDILACLEERGVLEEGEISIPSEDLQPATGLELCQSASMQNRVAFGPRSGLAIRREGADSLREIGEGLDFERARQRLGRCAALATLAFFESMPAFSLTTRCFFEELGCGDPRLEPILKTPLVLWGALALGGYLAVLLANRLLPPRASCILDLALLALFSGLALDGIGRAFRALSLS